mgnify:CR=1 FL=1
MVIDAERRFLWVVVDPRGITIMCAQEVWEEHTAYRPELAEHFEEVKLTVQEPDEIYFDPISTRSKAPGAKIYWYYKSKLARGRFAGNFVAVAVKVVLEVDGTRREYVQSALIPDRKEKLLILEWIR